MREHLAQAIAELPERERQILSLYYQEELTLAEIGDVIGVGESRVSQLRTQAIARLRTRLRETLQLAEIAMSKILSQDEIDALMSTAPAGRRRPRGRATRRRAPSSPTTSAAPTACRRSRSARCTSCTTGSRRNVTTSLAAYLRAVTEFSIVSVEQFSYSEFLMSLSDPTAFYAISMPPLDGIGALEINPTIAFTMVDRMLGGSGQRRRRRSAR